MISLLKFLDAPWELARGYLREDLDHLESAINQKFGSLAPGGAVAASAFGGDPSIATRYLSNTGPLNSPFWAQINLANGVSGRLAYTHLTAATNASKLLGRQSGTPGDWGEITLGTGLSMSGSTLNSSDSPHALLDGVIDSDTFAGTPVRGDLVVANSTPKWAKLAVGAAGTFFQGGTDPSWGKIPALTSTYLTSLDGSALTNLSSGAVTGGVVTSITGTANEIIASASTGAVTLSTPQAIATASTPQFATLGLGVVAPGSGLDVRGPLGTSGANGQFCALGLLTELTTIAAATNTDTVILLPANAIILAVSVRVTVALTAPVASFTVGDAGNATRFSTAPVTNAIGTTDPGTAAGAYYNATATAVRLTPDSTPGTTVGRVRVTIHYVAVTPPTS